MNVNEKNSTPAQADAIDNQNESDSNTSTNVDWEKRYKDTQSAYTKTRQELAEIQAKLELAGVAESPALTPEELESLSEYADDLDTYYKKRQELETQKKTQLKAKISEKVEKTEEQLAFENIVEKFPDFTQVVDLQKVKMEVPPKLMYNSDGTKKLFGEFLEDAYNYLKTPKGVGAKTPTIPADINIGGLPGGTTPDNKAVKKDFVAEYKKLIF